MKNRFLEPQRREGLGMGGVGMGGLGMGGLGMGGLGDGGKYIRAAVFWVWRRGTCTGQSSGRDTYPQKIPKKMVLGRLALPRCQHYVWVAGSQDPTYLPLGGPLDAANQPGSILTTVANTPYGHDQHYIPQNAAALFLGASQITVGGQQHFNLSFRSLLP